MDDMGLLLCNLVITMSKLQKARVLHREPLQPRLSTLVSAGFIDNKQPKNRVGGRVFGPECYAIMYILRGTGHYEDAVTGARKIAAGDVIVNFPGMPHSYHPD